MSIAVSRAWWTAVGEPVSKPVSRVVSRLLSQPVSRPDPPPEGEEGLTEKVLLGLGIGGLCGDLVSDPLETTETEATSVSGFNAF